MTTNAPKQLINRNGTNYFNPNRDQAPPTPPPPANSGNCGKSCNTVLACHRCYPNCTSRKPKQVKPSFDEVCKWYCVVAKSENESVLKRDLVQLMADVLYGDFSAIDKLVAVYIRYNHAG